MVSLTHPTRKDTAFLWTDKCEEAFLNLKEAFSCAPVHAHFNPKFLIIAETDSSDYALSGIISQIHPKGNDIR